MAQFDLTITLEYALVSATNQVTFAAYEEDLCQAMVREQPRESTDRILRYWGS